MRPDKRANIELQFNWLFVLIAGGVILVAFFGFIMKQKAASDQALAENIVKDIAFLAESAASAKKAWQTVEGSSKPIEAKCSDDCACTLSVDSFSKDFGDMILFVPSPLQGAKMVFWSQDWSIPFRTVNYLYMSSKSIKYWLIYSDASAVLLDELTAIFPKDLDMQTMKVDEISSIEDEDYETVKLVFLDAGFFSADDLASKLHESLAEIEVEGVLVDSSQQELTFYEKTSDDSLEFVSKPVAYSGLATMLGGIFARDKVMYSCQVEKALQRAETVIRIYEGRTQDLVSAQREGCFYEQALSMLQTMSSSAGDLSLEMGQKKMGFPIAELEQVNRDLLNQGCPLVY